MSKFLLITDEVPQDYTQHIPLVLQHWERPFRHVWSCLYKESKAKGQTTSNGYGLCLHTGWYAFEQYQIVTEFGGLGEPLRMFFPDEQTELFMYLKANFG